MIVSGSIVSVYSRFRTLRQIVQLKIPVLENFFSRVQYAAEQRGMTLTGLAEATGIALSTMYRWKESLPHHRTSKQIAEVLRVSEPWLREGFGEMESATLHEEPTLYRVERRASKGSRTGANPQPEGSEDALHLCHKMLDTLSGSLTPEELEHGLLAVSYSLNQFKKAKLEELQS